MKIEESSVTLRGQHSLESESKTTISTRCSFRTVFASVSEASEAAPGTVPDRAESGEKIRLMLEQLIAEIIALISGQKNPAGVNIREVLNGAVPQLSARVNARAQGVTGFTWENVRTETISEHESSDFAASGAIRTVDGKSVNFKLDLAMCRDYQCERKDSDSGQAMLRDPLVINFGGKATELDNARFDFDLDSDGKSESMHGLLGGSAFLALDRNGDGCINDGSELFGTQSGDGFADLAMLDGDGNHWLDDADIAFAALKAWSRDADGKDSLASLKEKGIGAIYLSAAETPFSLKDGSNHLRGQVRASGVYLREDGRAGSLQQIDLAV